MADLQGWIRFCVPPLVPLALLGNIWAANQRYTVLADFVPILLVAGGLVLVGQVLAERFMHRDRALLLAIVMGFIIAAFGATANLIAEGLLLVSRGLIGDGLQALTNVAAFGLVVLAAGGVTGGLVLRNRGASMPQFLRTGAIALTAGLLVFPSAVLVQSAGPSEFEASAFAVVGPADMARPDVWQITLDMYAGESSLLAYGGFDNRDFVQALIERGFTLPQDVHSNTIGPSCRCRR